MHRCSASTRSNDQRDRPYAYINAAKAAELNVSHIDSHGGIAFYSPWLFKEYWKAAEESNLPAVVSKEWVRLRGQPTDKPNVFEVGDVRLDLSDVPFDRILSLEPGILNQDWLQSYKTMLVGLPPGIYLLQVHLGFNDAELQAMTIDHPNWGAQWRQNDYDAINSPEFRKFLKDDGFILIGWKELKRMMADRRAADALHSP